MIPFARLREGMGCGLSAWLAYAAAEFLFGCILTISTGTYGLVGGWAWRPLALYLACYTAAGLLSGAAIGAFVPRRFVATAATLSVVLAFIVNLLSAWPLARSEDFALAVAVSAAAYLVRGKGPRLGPWTAAFVLLAAPWVSREALEEASGALKSAASAAAVLAVLAVWWSVRRIHLRTNTVAFALAVIVAEAAGVWIYSSRIPSLASTAHTAAKGAPNVVLITMDTVRADHLSLYGYPRKTSPELDRIARTATVYRQNISASDMTLPSHASIFTGVYPSWHGAIYSPPEHPFGRPLDNRFPTLAEMLAQRGYTTVAVAGNYAYFQRSFGLGRGFQALYAPRPVAISTPDRPFYLREGARRLLSLFMATNDFDRLTLTAPEINSVAETLLARAGRRRPFFLFVNYIDAHAPYVPTAPYDRLFPGKDPHFSYAVYQELKKNVLARKSAVTAPQHAHLVSQYDGAIALIDSQIGKLAAVLQRDGVYDNTIFIVAADHGEAFGERSLMEHSVVSVYQDQVHVPLVIRYPRAATAAVVDDPVSEVDLMPTILAVLGYPAPAHLQGRSLTLPAVPRMVLSEAFPTITHGWNPAFTRLKRALYLGSEKLIEYDNGKRELYDLKRDPGEQHDLSSARMKLADARSVQLAEWIHNIPRQWSTASSASGTNLQKLKSLGYVQ